MSMGQQPSPRIVGGELLKGLRGRKKRTMFAIERRDTSRKWMPIARFGSMEEAALALDEMVADGTDRPDDLRISELPR
jgi:hypothetical protein